MSSFFINQTRVDLDRCKLYRDGETLSLEPRLIQVLHYLAQHQGQVVSHKTLLDAIWTNTVVEASALQRCIAQLRKAFNDDARLQQVIATFPKKGYSLVAEVSWEAEGQENHTDESRKNYHRLIPAQNFSLSRSALAASFLGGILVILITIYLTAAPQRDSELAEQTSAQSSFTPISSLPGNASQASNLSLTNNPALLAAIGIPDDFPVYSPDGRYVVYPRYLEDRKAQLWARDLAYGNDFLLTDEAGNYEHLAWSQDGSQLVFVDSTCQSGPASKTLRGKTCANDQCASLKSVAVSQSETNALFVEKLTDCSPVKLLAPVWLNPKTLAVIEVDHGEASLVQYAVKSGERSTLYQSKEVIPYHLSFSRQTNILTIMTINASGKKELLFLDIHTRQLNKTERAVFVADENRYPGSGSL